MADIDSGSPIRSDLPGQTNYNDIIVKFGDGTNPATQLASVDTHGSLQSRIADATGAVVTSQTNGTQRALDVGINVAGIQVDPRQIRALTSADIVTAAQGAAAATHAGYWWVRTTDGVNDVVLAPASTAAIATQAALVVALSPNSPLPAGTNVIGSVNQGTSPWITKDQSDGSVTGGAAGAFSMLMGGQYNATLPTLTSAQQSAIQLDSSGRLIIRPLTAADIVTSAQGAPNTVANAWPTKITDGTNTAAVKAASTAAVATDPSLVVQLSPNNFPIPVVLSAAESGTPIEAYNTASAVAAGATSNHQYTVTAGKTLSLQQIEASASGKMKIEVQVETGVATNVFTTRFVQFNSTNTPNMSIKLAPVVLVAAGVRVQIIRTNKDLLAMDLYSTIGGQEQ